MSLFAALGLPPRSLRGRLLLLLIGGLVAAQTMSAVISFYDRKAVIERLVARRHAQRVVDLVRVLDELKPADRARVAAATRYPPIALGDQSLEVIAPAIGTADAVIASGEHLARATHWSLSERFAPPRKSEVRVVETVLRFVADANPEVSAPNGWGVWVRSSLRDGTPFTAYFEIAFPASFPFSALAQHLAVIVVVTAILVAFGVRWVTRPLSELADAAERFGRDLDAPPLVETGSSEIRRAARAFNSMQERLSRYLKSRVHALSAISHDLKTPITRMRLRAELIEDTRLRDSILRDMTELETMVASSLDFTRGLESNETPHPTDVNALIDSVCEDFRELGHVVQANGRASAPIAAQTQALKRCLANIIDNACKYGGHAQVSVEDGPGELVIRVSDSGPGVPENELERVFEPFYRVETSRSRDTGGTGLGLAIARNVAQSHHGQVALRNLAGGGLEATLTLPRA